MHLFLLIPNNSGSSLLHDLIATSRSVAVLPTEGQFHNNFVGPNPVELKVKHFFTEKEEVFKNKNNYEWSVIKSSWKSSWRKNNNDAKIFLQKSPPDILRADMLLENFPDTRFIMMIRNPYAVVEGILRGNPDANINQAAEHAIRCLEIQLENSEKYLNDLVLRYEDLTDDTEKFVGKIMEYLGIDDIDFRRDFQVKSYFSKIKNMNDDQIKRLTDNQIQEINKVFKNKQEVLSECGYEIIESIDFNFKKQGSIDIAQIRNILDSMPDDIWQEFTYRQNTFEVHKKTNTIPLIFSEDFESENVKYRPWFQKFSDEIIPIAKFLTNTYGFGYVTRAILVKLPAGDIIPTHVDAGDSLDVCHRMHIPIITNDQCYFEVGDEVINMKEGEIWEINNTNKPHSVKNLGNLDRVHLIVDWITVD